MTCSLLHLFQRRLLRKMTKKYDIIIVGAGAAGLMAALKLSQLGLSVVVLEQKSLLASGPST
ncbi:hypothetical protein CK626_05340 [Vandammella animalimorsus]|nr:hypothetical protein CK626_05340 [Vandammella animalimorsus]